MKDRIPANPGRVFITPESGGAPYYATVTRADNPTQNGDPINKNTLLKDTTAAMFGMGNGAVPDGVLQYIGKYAQHWWKRKALKTITQYREKKTEFGNSGYYARIYKTSQASKTITVDPNTGEITLGDPISLSTVDTYRGTYVVGKVMLPFTASDGWRDDTATDTTTIFYISTSASIGSATAEYAAFHYSYISKVTAEAYELDIGGTDFVQAPNAEAYPHSGSDGSFEYTYLGQPWENAVVPVKVATGSYAGTGGYKATAASSLTFDFAPKFLAINVDYNNKSGASIAIVRPDAYTNYAHVATIWGNRNAQLIGKVSGETVYWYSTESANDQMNASGYTYHYIAWG